MPFAILRASVTDVEMAFVDDFEILREELALQLGLNGFHSLGCHGRTCLKGFTTDDS